MNTKVPENKGNIIYVVGVYNAERTSQSRSTRTMISEWGVHDGGGVSQMGGVSQTGGGAAANVSDA